MPKSKKPRKGTRAALAEQSRTQAEAAPPSFGPVNVEFDPEYEQIQGIWYSRRQVAEAVIAQNKKSKHKAGRPAIPRKFEILDAAALAKVRHGRYTQIAADWNLTPRQLTDLVEHHRSYFDTKIDALRKTFDIKA